LYQRRFFAAHESACAKPDVEVERETRIHDVAAKKPGLFGLSNRNLQTRHCNRIFSAHIHVALIRADAVSGDNHGLQDAVRIAFKYRAVHESAGVAFVGVAQHILHIVFVRRGKFPLLSRRKSTAAATTQAGFFDLVDDFFGWRLVGQYTGQHTVAPDGDIFIDILGVDNAAVTQCNAHLIVEKVDIAHCLLDAAVYWRFVQKALNNLPLRDVLFNDVFRVFRRNAAVKRMVRMNGDNRPLLTEAKAAGFKDLDAILHAAHADFFLQLRQHLLTSCGSAAGARAHENVNHAGAAG
jgi:hypothetical protein